MDITELIKKASKGGAEDQFRLGCYYSNVPDYNKAMEWYLKAANQGHAQAYPYICIFFFFRVLMIIAALHRAL
jgi:TPR repeat protein